MIRICIESPLAGDFLGNIAYARQCLHWALGQGVAPFASHLLYPQAYDDRDADMREAGIQAGMAFGDSCDARWFFEDRGTSPGMQRAADRAFGRGQEMRRITLGNDAPLIQPTPGFQEEMLRSAVVELLNAWARAAEPSDPATMRRALYSITDLVGGTTP